MRIRLCLGGAGVVGGLLLVAAAPACSSTSPATAAPDAGGTIGKRDGGGLPDDGIDGGGVPKPQTVTLKTGAVHFVAKTSDDQVVYTIDGAVADTRDIEVVALTGGEPVKLGTVASDGNLAIAGVTVAFWTDVDAASEAGKINLWTKAGGLKVNVATQSVVGQFDSSLDGSRVAFTFNSPADTATIAVTTPGVPSTVATATTAVIPNVNLIAAKCKPNYVFGGNAFFGVWCNGNGNGLTAASLVVVAASASPTPTTVINGAQTALDSNQLAVDKAGDNAFVRATNSGKAKLVAVAGSGVKDVESNVRTGFFSEDGLSLIYETESNALKRIPSAGGTATTLVATPQFAGRVALSRDRSRVLFHSKVSTPAAGDTTLIDLKLGDTTNANQTPVELLTTPTGLGVGFTASGTHLLFLSDVPPGKTAVGNLKSRAVSGAATSQDVASGVQFAAPLAAGTKAIVIEVKTGGSEDLFDIKIFDAAAPSAPLPLVSGVRGDYGSYGTTFVYTKPVAAGGGLYAMDIP